MKVGNEVLVTFLLPMKALLKSVFLSSEVTESWSWRISPSKPAFIFSPVTVEVADVLRFPLRSAFTAFQMQQRNKKSSARNDGNIIRGKLEDENDLK